MKIFGLSLWMVAFLLAALVIGAKNPGLVARIPLLNRI